MLRLLHHRGPDDEGTWVGESVAFGMRRLSIIDIAGGRQPMWRGKNTLIVYNGELYNHQTLRAELEHAGYHFHTSSDTEVLLTMYDRYGSEMFSRLEGMFALAIFDVDMNAVLLARDRFGEKPLYYSIEHDTFIFSSELKSLLAGLERRPSVNYQGMHDYLTYRFVDSARTIWDGIHKLRPAHFMLIDLRNLTQTIRPYWSLKIRSAPFDSSRSYADEFHGLFTEAVARRYETADVPVGILLSGGLDSSLIAAGVKALGHKDIHTFSVGFVGDAEFDETNYAALVSRSISSQHHQIHLSRADFMQNLQEVVYHADEPLADLSTVPLYVLCKTVRRHVKVALSGEGADELFGGYRLDRDAHVADAKRRRLAEIPPTVLFWLSLLPVLRQRQELRDIAAFGWTSYLITWAKYISFDFSEVEKRRLWQSKVSVESTEDRIRNIFINNHSVEAVDMIQGSLLDPWLPDDLLAKADRMSMAHSVELRCPFLDSRLAEWAAKLPIRCKIGTRQGGYTTKEVLRSYGARYLPRSILSREKRGFPVPAYQWLATQPAPWAQQLLRLCNEMLGEYLDADQITLVFRHAMGGSSPHQHKAWNLIILALWFRVYVQNCTDNFFENGV